MRLIPAILAVTAAVAFAACGSDEEPSARAPAITAGAAKASVERAAGLSLAAEPVLTEARDQGVVAAFSNTATAAKDRQAVVLFLLEDGADAAAKLDDLRRGSAPPPVRLIVNDNVIVGYAAAGTDRGSDVEKAVEAL
jgi:hypothetical protein